MDALLRLTVSADGSASGPFLRMVEFMKLRNQRLDWGRFDTRFRGEYPGPALDRFGLTVTPDGTQRPWLDDLSNPLPAPN
ncbi:hypothetical protein [Streptacidiphilus sp. P02-A3a]|uniref:hypothetical protein n=1 Tax=Streptacidiphilus sp. P02-A3a TaxID=2704468 RepID=UPI001CDCD446|nr:hypothetical protein [Streptacidiphilus sp. P02-A3a]